MTVFRSRPEIEPIPVFGPYMDAGRNPNALQKGTFAEIVGADGRFIGGIKPFPGFKFVVSLGSVVSGLAPQFLRYFAIQKGTTTNQLRGFVVLGSVDGNITQNLYLVYYDTGTAAWASYTVATGVSSTASIGNASVGKFLYVAVGGSAPLTLFHDGTNWQKRTMGPQYLAPALPVTPTEVTSGGVLPPGTYGVAYRFYDPDRGVYSGMSYIADGVVADTGGVSCLQFDIPYPGTGGADVHANFTSIQIFRTITAASAGSTFDAGVLYWETSVPISTAWTSGTYHALTGNYAKAGTLYPDVVLVQQTAYDPWENLPGTPPQSGAIDYYQSTMFMGRPPTASGGLGGFQWSGVTSFDPENFNPNHLCRGSPGEGEVLKFVQAGDVEYALTSNVIYRIRKLGTQLSVSRLHSGRGLVSSTAAHGVGDDLLLLTPLGIAVVNGNDGSMAVHTELDRLIYGRWAPTLDYVFSGYDAALGASIWVNPYQREAIILWHTTKLVTLLKGVYGTTGDSGPDPVSGGVPRFYLVGDNGAVLTPDLSATPTGTMDGITGASVLNGTVTTASSDGSIVDSGLTPDSSLVGARIYGVTGAYAGGWGYIAAIGTHTLNPLWQGGNKTTVVGDRYAISPVLFSLTCRPLETTTQEIPDAERVVWKGMSVVAPGSVARFGAANAYWGLGAIVDGVATTTNPAAIPLATGIAGMPSATDPGAVAGFKVQPVVSCSSTGAQFEIIGLEAIKTMGAGRST
jgi:hypothetical protein